MSVTLRDPNQLQPITLSAPALEQVKKEMKEFRWRYMSAKADLMYNCKMTEVANAVKPLGLKTLDSPPQKIVIAKGEY